MQVSADYIYIPVLAIILANVLWRSGNHWAASLVGENIMNGWAQAQTVWLVSRNAYLDWSPVRNVLMMRPTEPSTLSQAAISSYTRYQHQQAAHPVLGLKTFHANVFPSRHSAAACYHHWSDSQSNAAAYFSVSLLQQSHSIQHGSWNTGMKEFKHISYCSSISELNVITK